MPVLAVGCGGAKAAATQPVKGRVLVDGKPVEGAIVTLHSTRSSAEAVDIKPTGRTDADGNFALSTNETADGAPVGEYAVTVAWFPVPVRRRPDDNDGISPKNVLLAYSDPARTPLKAIVQDGKNEPLTLNVKRR